MALLPKVKLKAMVSFPASVLDGNGIDVVRQSGNYRLDLDFSDFAPPVGSLTDPAHQNVLLWNDINGSYVLLPASVLGGAGSAFPSNANPAMDGVAAPGVSALYSRADHVHPSGGGGGTPGGVDTQVQFNDGGAFGGDSGLTYNKTTDVLSVAGNPVGYLNVPQNSQSAAYTAVLADSGKHLFHPAADTTARTFTIPANSSVAYPVGTALTFVNQNGGGVVTIAITTDTMRLAGAGTTGSRTLAANGIATALKVTSTEWIISGTGLT